jgi:molecular chaperone DnaJ
VAIDEEQELLLRQLAALRGEEKPEAGLNEHPSGLFGKLKDAFSGR